METWYTLATVCRFVLCATLLIAGVQKLRLKDAGQDVWAALGFRGKRLPRVLTRALPTGELALAVWLASGWLAVGSGIATLVLVLGFHLVLWRLRTVGYDGGCRCFGVRETGQIGRVQVARNLTLLVASLAVVAQVLRAPSEVMPLWSVPPVLAVTAATIVVTLAGVYLLLVEISRLGRRA